MHNPIHELRQSINDLSAGRLTVTAVCQTWRAQHELLSALPAQFSEVMENLLGRLEASQLFIEESCSFSQADLIAQLGMWLDKAETSRNTPRGIV